MQIFAPAGCKSSVFRLKSCLQRIPTFRHNTNYSAPITLRQYHFTPTFKREIPWFKLRASKHDYTAGSRSSGLGLAQQIFFLCFSRSFFIFFYRVILCKFFPINFTKEFPCKLIGDLQQKILQKNSL